MFDSNFVRIKVGVLGSIVNVAAISSVWPWWDKKNRVWKLNITYKNGRSNLIGYYGSIEELVNDMEAFEAKLRELGLNVGTWETQAVYSSKDLAGDGEDEGF